MKVSHIKDLVTHRLAKHLTLVFTGNIFAAFLGFLAVLIVSRGLTVYNFGLFNMAISAMLIASRLSGLGMDTAMIRFILSYLVVGKTADATQVQRISIYCKEHYRFYSCSNNIHNGRVVVYTVVSLSAINPAS